jgi:AraC-like DNA-binding protein
MEQDKIPAYYFGHIVEVLEWSGFDADAWLAKERLSIDDFLSLDASITYQQFESLLSQLLSYEEYQNIGLKVGQRLKMTHHGFFGLGLANCENVYQAMQFQQRFISMRMPNVQLEIVECDTHYQLLIVDQYWKDAHHRAVIDALVYALCTAFLTYEFVDGSKLQSIEVEFDFEVPIYAEQYQAIGAKKVSFARVKNSILIPKANVLSPIKGVDNISFLQAKQMCENALSQQNHKPPIDYLVERCIEKGLDRQDYSIDSVAKQVGMSKRTLHRQLLRRNTNYKQILDAVRKKRILETLSKRSASVTELAYNLDYSDLANFRRAFKRIFGITPQAYLKTHGR